LGESEQGFARTIDRQDLRRLLVRVAMMMGSGIDQC
jgi:hypothetical protein